MKVWIRVWSALIGAVVSWFFVVGIVEIPGAVGPELKEFMWFLAGIALVAVFAAVLGWKLAPMADPMSAGSASPAEAETWRQAVAAAERDGTFFIAQTYHCAVGTKPG